MQLYDVLKETGTLNIFEARFYIGSLILCLEYLHIHGIVHRGIYPEMITVAEDVTEFRNIFRAIFCLIFLCHINFNQMENSVQ